MPGRLPGSRRWAGGAAPGGRGRRRRPVPGAGGRTGGWVGDCRASSCPRASTSNASARCPPTARRRDASPLRSRPRPRRWCSGSAGSCPAKGFDVLIDAVAGLPDVQLAIAGSGRDRRRLEAHARRRGIAVAGAVPGSRPRRRLVPAALRQCRRVLRCRAATGGVGSRPRASASCSSRPRPPACPRWRGAVGVRTRRWSTARPGSSWRAARSTCAPRSAPTAGRRRACGRGWASPPATRAVDEFAYDAVGGAAGTARRRRPRRPRARCRDGRYARRRERRRRPRPRSTRASGSTHHPAGWVANVGVRGHRDPASRSGVDDALGVAIGVTLLLFVVAVVTFGYAFARRSWRAAPGATTWPSPTCSSSRARRPSRCGGSSS